MQEPKIIIEVYHLIFGDIYQYHFLKFKNFYFSLHPSHYFFFLGTVSTYLQDKFLPFCLHSRDNYSLLYIYWLLCRDSSFALKVYWHILGIIAILCFIHKELVLPSGHITSGFSFDFLVVILWQSLTVLLTSKYFD